MTRKEIRSGGFRQIRFHLPAVRESRVYSSQAASTIEIPRARRSGAEATAHGGLNCGVGAPGRFDYKFIVDGLVLWGKPSVSACADCVPDPFGTMNRVIEVRGPLKPRRVPVLKHLRIDLEQRLIHSGPKRST